MIVKGVVNTLTLSSQKGLKYLEVLRNLVVLNIIILAPLRKLNTNVMWNNRLIRIWNRIS